MAKPAGKAATARTYSRSISKATPAPTHRRFWKDRASTLKSCIGEIFWWKIAQVFESTTLQAHCAEPRRRKHSLTTTECTQRRRPQSPKSHSWNEGEHLQIPNRINKTNTARWHWFMFNCFYKYLTLSWQQASTYHFVASPRCKTLNESTKVKVWECFFGLAMPTTVWS